MSNPEGARKTGRFMAICSGPDYCWTPIGGEKKLVPYMIACDFSESLDCSPNVFFTSEPVFLFKSSEVPQVKGNEPGVAGGLISDLNQGSVWVEEHAEAVYVNGIQVVRHGDRCWMNHPHKT